MRYISLNGKTNADVHLPPKTPVIAWFEDQAFGDVSQAKNVWSDAEPFHYLDGAPSSSESGKGAERLYKRLKELTAGHHDLALFVCDQWAQLVGGHWPTDEYFEKELLGKLGAVHLFVVTDVEEQTGTPVEAHSGFRGILKAIDSNPDFRQMTIHAYTVNSKDAAEAKFTQCKENLELSDRIRFEPFSKGQVDGAMRLVDTARAWYDKARIPS